VSNKNLIDLSIALDNSFDKNFFWSKIIHLFWMLLVLKIQNEEGKKIS